VLLRVLNALELRLDLLEVIADQEDVLASALHVHPAAPIARLCPDIAEGRQLVGNAVTLTFRLTEHATDDVCAELAERLVTGFRDDLPGDSDGVLGQVDVLHEVLAHCTRAV